MSNILDGTYRYMNINTTNFYLKTGRSLIGINTYELKKQYRLILMYDSTNQYQYLYHSTNT